MITRQPASHPSRISAMKNIVLPERSIGLALAMALPLVVAACQEPNGQTAASANAGTSASAAASQPLHQNLLTAYIHGAVPFKPLPNCNLESLNSDLFGAQPLMLNPFQPNTLKGWVDPTGTTDSRLWLRFDDAQARRYLHAPLQLTIERSDVLTSDPGAPRVSGFELRLPRNSLPAGRYHIYIAVTSDSTAHICDNGRQIDVGN